MILRPPSRALRTTRLLGRCLWTGRGRRAFVLSGMAASTLLVLVLLGARDSVTRAVVSYAGQPGCDLWIAPKGTDNLIRSGSLLPVGLLETVRRDPAVTAAEPLLRTFVTVEHGARRVTLLAIGYGAPGGLGGPPELAAGHLPDTSDDILLDRAAAHRLGARPGSLVLVNGERMRVSGLTRRTNLIGTQLAFGDLDEAASRSGIWGRASFLVVTLASGTDPASVAARLEARMRSATVHTRAAFVANNAREVTAGFGPLVVTLAVLGTCVAVALIALVAHAAVDDRREELALLLALGVPFGSLARAVVLGMSLVALEGAALGGAVALALSIALDRFWPVVELSLHALDWAVAFALCCAAAAVAAAGPVRRLRDIDPLEAFRP